jgi:cytochrome P450
MEFSSDGAKVSCTFDHHSPEFATHYRVMLDELRTAAPLVWSEAYGGFWIATRHDVVRRLANDAVSLTVDPGPERTGGLRIPTPPGMKTRPFLAPGEIDGGEHDAYRLALNPHFSRQRMNGLAPMIQRHVDSVVDDIIEKGRFDVIDDVASPILSLVTCEHLGLEVDDPPGLFDAMMDMISYVPRADSTIAESFDAVEANFGRHWQLVLDTIAARTDEPKDDVISHLLQWDKPRFSPEQVQMMALNVILGASHTTKSLIGQAVAYLAEHPEERQHLAANPQLMRSAVNEFLRLFTVAVGLCRTATKDIEVGDVTIKAGDRLLLAYAAANHDPNKYPHPEVFDLDRGSAQHLALGVGSHFCLGAWMANAIASATLQTLVTRVPYLVVETARVVTAHDKSTHNAYESMPAATSARLLEPSSA